MSNHTHQFSVTNTHSHRMTMTGPSDSGKGKDYVVSGPADPGNDRGLTSGYFGYKSGRKFINSGDTTITIRGTTDPTYNNTGNPDSLVYKSGAKVQPDNINIKVWERTK